MNEPYYALIKAENVDEASKRYVEVVAGDGLERPLLKRHFTEVDRDYALVSYVKSKDEVGDTLETTSAIEEFNKPTSQVLLIDSQLL